MLCSHNIFLVLLMTQEFGASYRIYYRHMKESFKPPVASVEKEDEGTFPDAEGGHLSEVQKEDLRSLLSKVTS